jgi:hypothetical protein
MASNPDDYLVHLQRFRTDFEFYAPRALKILNKSGQLIPFHLNKSQIYAHNKIEGQLKRKGLVRKIILKARQQGFSTYTQGRFYWKVTGHFGKKAFILTHLDEATTNLFNIGKRFHDHCPLELKPSTKNKSEKSLFFDQLNSGYSVGTARSDGTGRSGTFQYLHASEMAFWRNAPVHMAGIGQTLPYEPGTESLIESTADGISNMYHEIWQDAVNGISDYEPIFIPWYWQFEYQRPVPAGFVLDADETEYMETYDLTLPQMVWRRYKINTDFRCNASLFAQEYPATPEEAFMASIEGTLIKPQKIQLAVKKHGKIEPYGLRLMGVDPAEYGEDDTAFAYRQGPVMEEPETFHGINQMQTAGLVALRIDQKRIDKVMVDTSGGWGGGVVARLGELGYGSKIIRINFGESAIDRESYAKRRDEMWGDMAEWFDGDEPVSIPANKRLQAELSSPKYDLDSSRRLKLESKEQMKKRGIKSPDIADAAALTFAYKLSNTSSTSTERRPQPNWRAM